MWKVCASNTRLNRPVVGRLPGLVSVGEEEISADRVCALSKAANHNYDCP